eukprot:scaffold17703_cov49-Prasinocladus_malaysianus.AAC.1
MASVREEGCCCSHDAPALLSARLGAGRPDSGQRVLPTNFISKFIGYDKIRSDLATPSKVNWAFRVQTWPEVLCALASSVARAIFALRRSCTEDDDTSLQMKKRNRKDCRKG